MERQCRAGGNVSLVPDLGENAPGLCALSALGPVVHQGLQPVEGKKPGDQTDFQDPYLFNTTVHPLP